MVALPATAPHIDRTLVALADPTRRRIVELLGERPHRAGELASATEASPSQTSKHLKVLMNAGLLNDERVAHDARIRIFHLRREAITDMTAWLTELQASWDERLVAFKKHVESQNSEGT